MAAAGMSRLCRGSDYSNTDTSPSTERTFATTSSSISASATTATPRMLASILAQLLTAPILYRPPNQHMGTGLKALFSVYSQTRKDHPAAANCPTRRTKHIYNRPLAFFFVFFWKDRGVKLRSLDSWRRICAKTRDINSLSVTMVSKPALIWI